jgi:hypothetical protein
MEPTKTLLLSIRRVLTHHHSKFSLVLALLAFAVQRREMVSVSLSPAAVNF